VRRFIGIMFCAAIAALTSAPARGEGAHGNAYAPDPGPSRNDQAAGDAHHAPAAEPRATTERASEHWDGPRAARSSARAPERRTRVYWRSDRGRVKSRADFAPN
jgi:hypothetical protein